MRRKPPDRDRLAVLDLPEGNAMRAPGEAPGMMALEIAIDEMAEKLGLDPVEFRIINDTQVVPDDPSPPPSLDPQAVKQSEGRLPGSEPALFTAPASRVLPGRSEALRLEPAPSAARPGS